VKTSNTFSRNMLALLVLSICNLFALSATAQVAIQGGTVHTVSGDVIEGGTVLVSADGKIEAVGKSGAITVPGAYKKIDASGKIVTPGLFDAYTTIGLVEIWAVRASRHTSSGPGHFNASHLAAESLNRRSANLPIQREGGVTDVVIIPEGGVIQGQAAHISLAGEAVFAATITPSVAMVMRLGSRAASTLGTSRGGVLATLRQVYQDARFYQANKTKYNERRSRDLSAPAGDLDALSKTFERGLPVMFLVDQAGDIEAALAFAKDRRQSRSLDPEKQDANAEADNILVHPDVRRMLLNVKTTTMALRALATYIAVEYDVAHHHEDEDARQQADDLVALLTPIIKSYGSERGFENISEAMQVCGGAGYTTDWNIEQYLRDERIAMIYEGTNHIQALDLVGRKLPMKNGRLMQNFSARVTELIRGCKDNEALEPFVTPLKDASKKLTAVTWELAAKGAEDREVAGAVASHYLNLFALTTLAFVWTIQAKYIVENEVADGETRLKLGRYFMDKVLPEVDYLVSAIGSGKSNIMEFDVEEF